MSISVYECTFSKGGGDLKVSFFQATNNAYSYALKKRQFGESFEVVEPDGFVDQNDNLNDEYEIAELGMDGGTLLVGYIAFPEPGRTAGFAVPFEVTQSANSLLVRTHPVKPADALKPLPFVIKLRAV